MRGHDRKALQTPERRSLIAPLPQGRQTNAGRPRTQNVRAAAGSIHSKCAVLQYACSKARRSLSGVSLA